MGLCDFKVVCCVKVGGDVDVEGGCNYVGLYVILFLFVLF